MSVQLIGVARTSRHESRAQRGPAHEYSCAVVTDRAASPATVLAEVFPDGPPQGVEIRLGPLGTGVWNVVVTDADRFIGSYVDAGRGTGREHTVAANIVRMVAQYEIADATHDFADADRLAGELVELSTRGPGVHGVDAEPSSYEIARASWLVIPPDNEVDPTPPGLHRLFASAWTSAKSWEHVDPSRRAQVEERILDQFGPDVKDLTFPVYFDSETGKVETFIPTVGDVELGQVAVRPAPRVNSNPGLDHPLLDPIDLIGPPIVMRGFGLGARAVGAVGRRIETAVAGDLADAATIREAAKIGGYLETFASGSAQVRVLANDAYTLRLGSGTRPGSFGTGLFHSLDEAVAARDALVAELTHGAGLQATRRTSAIPHMWEKAFTEGRWPVSELTDVQIAKVPAGTKFLEGVVGPQQVDEATVYAAKAAADDAVALMRKGADATTLSGGAHQIAVLGEAKPPIMTGKVDGVDVGPVRFADAPGHRMRNASVSGEIDDGGAIVLPGPPVGAEPRAGLPPPLAPPIQPTSPDAGEGGDVRLLDGPAVAALVSASGDDHTRVAYGVAYAAETVADGEFMPHDDVDDGGERGTVTPESTDGTLLDEDPAGPQAHGDGRDSRTLTFSMEQDALERVETQQVVDEAVGTGGHVGDGPSPLVTAVEASREAVHADDDETPPEAASHAGDGVTARGHPDGGDERAQAADVDVARYADDDDDAEPDDADVRHADDDDDPSDDADGENVCAAPVAVMTPAPEPFVQHGDDADSNQGDGE